MRLWTGTLALSAFLLADLGRSSIAHADGLVFWDQSIATAISDSLTVDEVCQPNPYALYRQTCVSNQLNVTLERSPFEKLTFLDHIALFVHKHRNLTTTQQLMRGVRFRVGVNLSNVYQQEAKLEGRLRVHW